MVKSDSFEIFKTEFTKEGKFYVPKNLGDNSYRHLGLKIGSKLMLDSDEIRYLYSRAPLDNFSMRSKAYFELKNSDMNILRVCEEDENLFYVFNKTKHFCRNKEVPLAVLKYFDKDECVTLVDIDTVAGILGRDTHCFVKLRPVLKLSTETPSGLYK
ncbi:hypothetical protein PAEPH01_0350 [Pancytospora epiphaga]|nr:hypothetical protein PAEPH01_0350 [Pancytospora epiphaga]